ncbi:MAG TPA: DUF4286 family protein [Chitinophagales bacterium]|nr:DUF4286 family protein [Chitinophagales bacterium]HMX03879.1 DUF4286 family protein [Chitinophagales bacterium]HNA57393.1 DUF4286 family protein [Chitinophagales bacterium]HNF67775.1 DUF4286 family protein [Chitinophagales bacterium]HNI55172.1 DUF4286 family protein [Chitinophagales bacterium]
MYLYNVTIKIEQSRADEWLTWMREKHIPDVMATGFFVEYRLCRLVDDGDMEGMTFVVQYTLNNLDDFLTYKLTSGPSLQRDTQEKFGNDFFAFRTLMEII